MSVRPHMALLRSLADRGERMAINMTLLRSLADHGARRAINMALLMELAASPPRPLGCAGDACKTQFPEDRPQAEGCASRPRNSRLPERVSRMRKMKG